MYDLPMKTKLDIRRYNKFRKNIISNGFVMLQESVYYRYIKYTDLSNYVIKQVLKKIPSESDVRFIVLTLLQFKKMNKYSSKSIDLSLYKDNILMF